MERQLTQAAQRVLDDLAKRGPSDALLSALQLADPRFWRGQEQADGGSRTAPTRSLSCVSALLCSSSSSAQQAPLMRVRW